MERGCIPRHLPWRAARANQKRLLNSFDNMETAGNKRPRRWWRKFKIVFLSVLVAALAVFVWIRFYFPYGEGVKTGQLNFVVRKGIVFKTYEGKLIQTGFWSAKAGAVQSNEFNFSIADKEIAEQLMNAGGQVVELHYTEYFGALPWRGFSKYVVDKIVNMEPAETGAEIPPVLPEVPAE